MKSIVMRTKKENGTVNFGPAEAAITKPKSSRKRLFVTDETVFRIYRQLFSGLEVFTLPPGEESKSLSTIESIYRRCLELEIDRSSLIIGVGGGVVTDIAGYAASTYMRGVPFGFLPSTLVAQVDASLGGKNGVNLDGYKNLIGTFRQPEFVQIDFRFLQTLPLSEILCGGAEIVKHALIASRGLFEYLEERWAGLLNLGPDTLERAVGESISIKSERVEDDAEDLGVRRTLNFGHTLGHALERSYGIRHGEAVSLGMVFASRLSLSRGMLTEIEARRIKDLLDHLGLPTHLAYEPAPVIDAVRRDKKRNRRNIDFVLLDGIGRASIAGVSLHELEEHIHDLRQSG